MTYQENVSELASKINFLAFKKYLLHKGWQQHRMKRGEAISLVSPDDNPSFDILFPLSRAWSDYAQQLLDAIKKVAKYEQREEFQLINDLTTPPADTVRYRIDSEKTRNGIIPLKSGFDLLESARKSLLTTASDIIAPSVYHKRMSYKEAIHFVDSCYLGQSERGSYVASIICPFVRVTEQETEQLSLFTSDETLLSSITRSVTKRLMSSITRLKIQIEAGNLAEIDTENSGEVVSINFLESLVEINEFNEGSKVEISTTWSPTVGAPDNIPSTVEITHDYIEPIKSIIDRLKPTIPDTPGDFVGKISAIQANPDINSREGGEITFVFINDDQKAINAKVNLQSEDIHSAIRAFDQGRNIRITGNLKISSRQRMIDNPVFHVIE